MEENNENKNSCKECFFFITNYCALYDMKSNENNSVCKDFIPEIKKIKENK